MSEVNQEPLILDPEPEPPVPDYPNLVPWVKGQTGNPQGVNSRMPKVRMTQAVLNALFDNAARDGKVDMVFNEYFDLMLHAKDARLRFDVIKDFFDRLGLKPPQDAKVQAQIVNVVRSNSPDLNL